GGAPDPRYLHGAGRRLCPRLRRRRQHRPDRGGHPAPMTTPDRRDQVLTRDLPLPLPTLDTQPFYEATRRGELRLQRCTECKTFRHYPRPTCPECLSRDYSWERASGRGTIYTWTIVRGPTLPAF